MTVEQKVKAALAAAGVSQADLARRLETTPSNLNQKLRRNSLSDEELIRIAHVLGAEWISGFVYTNRQGVALPGNCFAETPPEYLPHKCYTIVGGVNGVGKSSLTGVLKGTRPDLGAILDVDRLTAQRGGNAVSGGREAIRRIRHFLENGLSFTQETTLAGRKTEQTVQEAHASGYTIRLYYVALDSLQECLRRIENRVRKGGHAIPPADVERRFARRWAALARILPYCDSAEFYDNENGFVKVAEYHNGEFLPIGTPRGWVKELQDYLQDI